MRASWFGLGSIAFVFTTAPAAAVTTVAGGIQVRPTAFTQGKQNPATLSTVFAREAWSGAPPTRIVNSGAEASARASNVERAMASGRESAFWAADGLSGNVSFVFSWVFGFGPEDGVVGAEFNGTNPNWFYTFQARRPGVFRLDYIVGATGNPFGLTGWNLEHDGNTVLALQNSLDPRTRGSFEFSYDGGRQHSFSLVNNANIVPGAGNASLQGTMTATFRYFISESTVPEPGIWTMTILGFGMIGATVRRGRDRLQPAPARPTGKWQ